jgi:acyl-CoA synthetase (AMP-forming)/AMP-acid ligase II
MEVRIRDDALEVRLPEGSPYLYEASGLRYVDGWLRTFDRAELDESGAVHLAGRSDSLVVVGGLKLDLTEVETVLCGHPDVTGAVVVHADVTEAYVSTRDDAGPLRRGAAALVPGAARRLQGAPDRPGAAGPAAHVQRQARAPPRRPAGAVGCPLSPLAGPTEIPEP